MQVVNNLILDTVGALDGDWRNISNFIALSIHVVGLDADTYIEASNDPASASGVRITGNIGLGDPSLTDEIAIFYGPVNTVMVNPSCLAWNYIRVTKGAGGAVETKAWLFGQNG